MNLAQALKWKARIIRELNNAQNSISENNTLDVPIDEEPNPPIDINKTMERVNNLRDALVKIKVTIAKANINEIAELTYQMSEKKAHLSFLKEIVAERNRYRYSRGDNTKTVYLLDANEIERLSKVTQNEIDKLQDKLDQINAKTNIELGFSPEELVAGDQ